MKIIKHKQLILLLILAFLIRLIAVNQSLWLDEATTAQVVKQFGLAEIVTKFSPRDFHPPLYYLFIKLLAGVFGYWEVALRMPSIIFSLLTGWVVYLVGGLWTAAFFLFNPLVVYYSQEARMYMMVTFFLTGAFYFFNNKKWLLFSLLSILSFYTFYGSIFFIAAFFLYLLYKKQFKDLFTSAAIFFAGLVVISPLLFQQFANSKIALSQVANWSLVLGKANLKNLLLIPVKFVVGRIDFYPKWLYYSVAGLWTAFVWFFAGRVGIKNKLLSFLVVCPLAIGFLISFTTPLLQYFRFIYLIPIISLLLGKSPKRKVIIAGFIIFSLVYLLIPQFHREDWRSLAGSLPGNKPVYMITSSADPVKYYQPGLKINGLNNLYSDDLPGKIIVVPYSTDIHGVDFKNILRERKYSFVDKKTFRDLEIEEWSL